MSSKRTAYSYSVLRYVHDAISGEFLNVGVVLFAAQPRAFFVRMTTSFLRLQQAFPGCNTGVIKRELTRVETMLHDASFDGDKTLEASLQAVIAPAARGLQWSNIGAGVCTDPNAALNDLFANLVAKRDSMYASLGVGDDCGVSLTHFRRQPALYPKVNLASSNDGGEWDNELEPLVASA